MDHKRWLPFGFVFFLALLPACGSSKATSLNDAVYTGDPSWTILVFMAADNDLEKAALSDLKEMAKEGSGNGASIIVQVDRSDGTKTKPGYSKADVLGVSAWTTAKRFLVTPGGLQELADLGETNTADPAVLQDFISWGLKSYPAPKTALILWDHGGGVLGYGLDETPNKAILSETGFSQAVSAGLAAAKKAKFDVLGFDACLMGNLETAYQLQAFADFYIGSEEVEPAHGWDYRTIVAAARTGVTPKDLANAALSGYQEQCKEYKDIAGCTLAVLDTSKLKALATAVSALGDELKGKTVAVPDWNTVAQAQTKSESYGAAPGGKSPFGIIDLWDFSQKAPASSTNAQAVRDALAAAVVTSFHGDARPNAHGVTVFFPTSAAALNSDYNNLAFSKDQHWGEFLSGYFSQAAADKTPPDLGQTTATANGKSFDISAPLSATDISSTQGLVAVFGKGDDFQIYKLIDIANGGTTFNWDQTILKVTDGSAKKLNLTLFSEYDYSDPVRGTVRVYSSYMNLHFESDYLEVVAFFEVPANGQPTLIKLMEYADSGVASEVEPEPGDLLEPVLYGYDAAGNETWTPVGDSFAAEDLTRFTLVSETAPAGDYLVGLIATDFAGNDKDSTTQVTIP